MHKHRKRRLVRLATVPAVATAVLAIGVGPVNAEETVSDGVVLQHYLHDTLTTSTRPAALAEGKSADRVRRFLDEAARNGRLVDVARVRVATVTDPYAGQIDLVWDDGAAPQYVGVTNRKVDETSQTGVGAIFSEPEVQAPSAPTAGGLGYEAGYDLQNMYQYGNTGCRTVYFDPDYPSSEDHWTTSCYQKFAQSGTDRWVYNRWALWDRANPHWAWRANTVDYTTRSRPWHGHESKVVALTNWTPATGTSQCTETLSVTLQVTTNVSVKIPIHRCSVTRVLPEATKHSMGMDWDGSTGSQLYEDYGMAIRASNAQVVPVMADYLWAEVQMCPAERPCAPYDPSQYLALKDSGWDRPRGGGGRSCTPTIATAPHSSTSGDSVLDGALASDSRDTDGTPMSVTDSRSSTDDAGSTSLVDAGTVAQAC